MPMPVDMLVALTWLAVVSAITPGPNNVMVASSGANFGYRRSVPHILGVSVGFAFMLLCVGLFLGKLFQQSWLVRECLRWAGVGLLIYVSWKIATSHQLGPQGATAKPYSFLQAAGFQWFNPKGWAMSIAVTSQFIMVDFPLHSAVTVAVVFSIVGFWSTSCWAILGQAIGKFLAQPAWLIWFNRTMALMILCCIVFLFPD